MGSLNLKDVLFEASVLAQILAPLQWYDLIWVAALPGISEELLFRGALIPAVLPDWYVLTEATLIGRFASRASIQLEMMS